MVKMPTFRIKSITVSMEIACKEFGNGNSGYASLTAQIDEGSMERLPDIVDGGLDMYVAAWETILAGKVATKLLGMTGQEFQTVVPKIRKRLTQVKAMLRAAGEVQQ
jgi:hypothetical protein